MTIVITTYISANMACDIEEHEWFSADETFSGKFCLS